MPAVQTPVVQTFKYPGCASSTWLSLSSYSKMGGVPQGFRAPRYRVAKDRKGVSRLIPDDMHSSSHSAEGCEEVGQSTVCGKRKAGAEAPATGREEEEDKRRAARVERRQRRFARTCRGCVYPEQASNQLVHTECGGCMSQEAMELDSNASSGIQDDDSDM